VQKIIIMLQYAANIGECS